MKYLWLVIAVAVLIGGGITAVYITQVEPFYHYLSPLFGFLEPVGNALSVQINGLYQTLLDNPLAVVLPALTASGALIGIFAQIKGRLEAQALKAEEDAALARDAAGSALTEKLSLEKENIALTEKLKMYEGSDWENQLAEATKLVQTKETEITKLRNQIDVLNDALRNYKLGDGEAIVKTVVK